MERLKLVDIRAIQEVEEELKITMLNVSCLEGDNRDIKELIEENIIKCIKLIDNMINNKDLGRN